MITLSLISWVKCSTRPAKVVAQSSCHYSTFLSLVLCCARILCRLACGDGWGKILCPLKGRSLGDCRSITAQCRTYTPLITVALLLIDVNKDLSLPEINTGLLIPKLYADLMLPVTNTGLPLLVTGYSLFATNDKYSIYLLPVINTEPVMYTILLLPVISKDFCH